MNDLDKKFAEYKKRKSKLADRFEEYKKVKKPKKEHVPLLKKLFSRKPKSLGNQDSKPKIHDPKKVPKAPKKEIPKAKKKEPAKNPTPKNSKPSHPWVKLREN